MTNIVRWQEVVGKDYLNEFERISKAIVFSRVKDPVTGPQTVLNKLKDDERERYDVKRDQLRRCGYEEDGKILRNHGWYSAFLDNGILKFTTTAKDRNYISMNKYIEWKRGMSIEEDQKRYYAVRPVVKRVMKEFDHED